MAAIVVDAADVFNHFFWRPFFFLSRSFCWTLPSFFGLFTFFIRLQLYYIGNIAILQRLDPLLWPVLLNFSSFSISSSHQLINFLTSSLYIPLFSTVVTTDNSFPITSCRTSSINTFFGTPQGTFLAAAKLVRFVLPHYNCREVLMRLLLIQSLPIPETLLSIVMYNNNREGDR